ncbi:MAG: hypothetical protein K1X67_22850 [Fimbriimonadaceae bacterium]|nr:hypothetical protein [Fimbriimonadaceae bacterium]
MSDEPARLVISTAIPGDEAIYLRVSPEVADDLQALMEEQGVFESRALEHAAGPELAILIASFGTVGGLHGIAAAMSAWFQRNEHKSVTLTRGHETLELHGLSRSDREAVVDRFLADAHQVQLKRNEEWMRLSESDDESGV